MIKKVLKDSSVYTLNTLITVIITIILVPFYTRVFTPGDYGVIDFLAIISNLVTLIVALEISQAVARYTMDTSGEERLQYASTALIFTISGFSLMLVIGWVFSIPLSGWLLDDPSKADIFRVSVLSMWATGIFYLLRTELRFLLQSVTYSIVTIVYSLVSIGLTFTFVLLFHTGVIGVFYSLFLAGVVGSLLAFYYSKSLYSLNIDLPKLKEMLEFSTPLVLSSIGVFVSVYIDRISIKELMSLSDMGVYGMGYRIASITGLLITGTQMAITPLIYAHYQEENTPKEIAKIFLYFMAASLLIILGFGLFSYEALVILTTPQYYGAALVMPIIASSLILSGLIVFAPGLGIAKETRPSAVINISGAVINLGLNILLIPILGILGSAIATLISAFLIFSINQWISQKYYPIPYSWKKIGISCFWVIILMGIGYATVFLNYSFFATFFLKIIIFIVGIIFISLFMIGFSDVQKIYREIVKGMRNILTKNS